MIVVAVHNSADAVVVVAADQTVALGVLDRWRIVVVDVFHGREVGGRYLGHVADHVRAVVVGRNAVCVGSVHLHVRLLRVGRVLALAAHRGGRGGATQQLVDGGSCEDEAK